MSTNDKLEALRKATCQYPCSQRDEGTGEVKVGTCGKPQMMTVSVSVIKELEDGRIEASESLSIGVPFCEYHQWLAILGLIALKEVQNGHKWHGIDKIAIVEGVLTAWIMSGKLQEELKNKEDSERQVQELLKEAKE